MARTIIRLYDDFATAQEVAHELVNTGFARDNISIMANDASGEYSRQIGSSEADVSGAGAGAGIGAVLGGGVGLLVGAGALAIPGIGPVIAAGPVLSALATAGVGAGIGAVTGGLVGALVDIGVPEEEAEYYAEGVRRGGAILTIHAPDEAEERAMNIINRSQSVDLDERASWWREQGWSSFDPNAAPYSAGDVAQERASYQAYSSNRSPGNPSSPGSRGWPEVEPAPGESTYRGDVTNNPGYRSEGWPEVEPGPGETGYQGDVRDNPNYESRGWQEVEPAPGETTYQGDVTDNPGYQSRGWTEVEPPEGETAETWSGSTTSTARATGSPGLVEDRAPAEGRRDVDLNADYTWEETKDNVREGWEETKDAARKGWQETKEAFDFDDDYDDDRFHQHFNTVYASRGFAYETYAPAYHYGYDLAYDPDFEDRDWADFEPEARQYWESSYEGPWEQFKDAIRHAWEETKEAIGLEAEEDFKTFDSRFRTHYNTAYASSGYDYDTYYAPAYRYGYDLAYDPDFDNRTWNEIEIDARREWEADYEGPWEQFKDAVRHAWQETKEAIGLADDDDDLTEFNRQRRSGDIDRY